MVVGKYHRSASQLKTFRTCPMRWKLQKLDRLDQQVSAAAIQGSAFHKAYELWELSDRKINPVHQFMQEYASRILAEERKLPREQWTVWGKGRTVQADIDKRSLTGQEQIKTYTDRCVASDNRPMLLPDGQPAVEVNFSLDLNGITVIGSIDVILQYGDLIWPRDLKTGGREVTELQLGIYALAIRECFGYECSRGDFYYGKDDTVTPMLNLERYTKQYLTAQFKVMEQMITQRLFLPSPGSDCFNCSVKQFCPEMR